MVAASKMNQIESLLAARQYPEAARLLAQGARDGDPEALTAFAHWRVAGTIVRRDLAEARSLFRRAAEAGRRDAALLHAYFLANGTGGPDDWGAAINELSRLRSFEPAAQAQLTLLEEMSLNPHGFPAEQCKVRELSTRPYVAACDGFMTPAECAYLRHQGEPALQPALVIDSVSGRMIPHPVRTSDNMIFGVFAEDLVVNALNRRMAAISRTLPAQGEPLQLLRYGPGGEYRAHMDALANEPNQRIATILVYLSDGYDGGETKFLKTGLSFRGKVGDALLFRNVTEDGRLDPMALHAGLPVRRGTKVIASRWIRREAFRFPPPQPLLPL